MAHLNTIERPASSDAVSSAPSAAARRAEANFAGNLAALADTQPRLTAGLGPARSDLDFVFGRDGYLTAFDREGRWWSGCSLPKRASAAMLRSLKVTGPVSCMLVPPHAASLRVALEMTGTAHAIVCLVPDPSALSVLLACDDFSAEVRQHRLWFAWGEGWTEELQKLFEDRPGLPTPTQFIRLPVTEQLSVERMIASAQAVFAAVLAHRAALAREMRDAWRPGRPGSRALCLLTTRQFTLWNDAAFTLGAALGTYQYGDAEDMSSGPRLAARLSSPKSSEVAVESQKSRGRFSPAPGTPGEGRGGGLDGEPAGRKAPSLTLPRSTGGGNKAANISLPLNKQDQIVHVYLDEPLHGSPLAMLSAAVGCNAMVTADVARADMTELLPREMPWVTWLTTPRAPAFAAAGPSDALLVTDAGWKQLAVDAGWPADRVELARWPDLPAIWAADSDRSSVDVIVEPPAGMAIIADTWPLDAPERLNDFSSQRLLWNSIREELEAQPLILAGTDPSSYLDDRLTRFSVSGEGLDRGLFVERLIVPCYGQGIARLLLGAGLPLQLYGGGWGDLSEFAAHAAGPIVSRAALREAVIGAAALVHVRPMTHAHPIEATGRPLVRPLSKHTDTFIRAAIDALNARGRWGATSAFDGSTLSIERILSMLENR